jgi:hypothetical protein
MQSCGAHQVYCFQLLWANGPRTGCSTPSVNHGFAVFA